MAKKVAKLVYIDLMVRVIVPEDISEDGLISVAVDKAMANVKEDGRSWFGEGITDIMDDEECPYNPENDEKKIG